MVVQPQPADRVVARRLSRVSPSRPCAVRKCEIRSRACSPRARSTSCPTTSNPASSASCAMPDSISSRPTTPTTLHKLLDDPGDEHAESDADGGNAVAHRGSVENSFKERRGDAGAPVSTQRMTEADAAARSVASSAGARQGGDLDHLRRDQGEGLIDLIDHTHVVDVDPAVARRLLDRRGFHEACASRSTASDAREQRRMRTWLSSEPGDGQPAGWRSARPPRRRRRSATSSQQ